MNQKGYRIALLAFVLLLTGTTVNASNAWQLKLYSGKVFWMGKELEQNPSMPFLQKEEVTYIPVRSLEKSGIGFTRYDAKTKNIYIDPYDTFKPTSVSKAYAQKEDDFFKLRINSSKTNYKGGENLDIWSSLDVKSTASITIKHGNPLVSYFLIDEDGLFVSETRAASLHTSTLHFDDQMISVWRGMLAHHYIGDKYGYFDKPNGEQLFHQEVARPLRLPAGDYTIGAFAEYSVSNEIQKHIENNEVKRKRLEATIKIKIE
ncbi:hypothetical protein [Paenibacillus sp. UMB4589-SE434]|uniref:hypothetical protein n=1 Tax=Paenibacillus sp. UMB4589-SE434 TaxID=3046314 RepID=UPI0025501A85|nr:hypothetical protein [Paenibacillus sp. UMB4589-SE434]MDK8183592.1 hypothetical protein [Paenibacillus sp. UMB4589-SE434]